ncbi:MAG: transglycosylase SLT domain-containing protein [Mycobacterium sp.]
MTDYTPAQIKQIITDEANKLGIPPALAMAVAQQESGMDPASIGDQGHSIGLFQLNDQGEGAGMSVAAREDPVTNTRIALTQIANVMRSEPNMSWGQIAAAAQRPADPTGYASSIDNAVAQDGLNNLQGIANIFGVGKTLGQVSAANKAQAGVTNTPVNLQSFAAQNGVPPQWVNDPEIGPLLQRWDNQEISDQQFYAAVEQTSLWKSTPQALRTEIALQATDPATIAQTLSNVTSHVQLLAQRMGVAMTPQQLSNEAFQAYTGSYSTDDARLMTEIAKNLTYSPGQQLGGDAATEMQQLQQAYKDYALPSSPQRLGAQLQQLVGGSMKISDVQAQLQQQAMTLYSSNPQLTQYLQQGHTVQDWADPYAQKAAGVLGINPDQINLQAPMWAKILAPAVDPKTGASTGQAMSIDQFDSLIRNDPTYGYDGSENAVQSASQLSTGIKQLMGAGAV